MTLFARRILFLAAFCAWTLASAAQPRPQHVVIISLDGGKPTVIQHSPMPNLEKLLHEGAHTWTATTIDPSVTLPSHTAMLTGVGPAKHKILWNDWRPANGAVKVPTVFTMAKQAGLTTAMFVGKEKFRHLVQTNTVDKFSYIKTPSRSASKTNDAASAAMSLPVRIAREAAAWLVQEKPNLCFIHFPDPDSSGHKYGWGSDQQMKTFAEVDAGIGLVMQALTEAGIAGQSVVIVTADHGGHGRTHGSKRPDDKLVPWIAWGEGVKKGFTIAEPVFTCDTTATALWLLNVRRPAALDGKPVTSAFE